MGKTFLLANVSHSVRLGQLQKLQSVHLKCVVLAVVLRVLVLNESKFFVELSC